MHVGRAGALSALSTSTPQRAPAPRPVAVLADIPNGVAGTRETLRIMKGFARQGVENPEQLVRGQALECLSGLPPRKWMQEITALHGFVRDEIRYTRDPEDTELVQTPEATLRIRQGDCDDKATLLASMLKATGHPARFVAVGFENQPFSHVLVETKINDTGMDARDWMPLETILPGKSPGWYPAGVTSRYVLKV